MRKLLLSPLYLLILLLAIPYVIFIRVKETAKGLDRRLDTFENKKKKPKHKKSKAKLLVSVFFTLVLVLAATTYHYNIKVDSLQGIINELTQKVIK